MCLVVAIGFAVFVFVCCFRSSKVGVRSLLARVGSAPKRFYGSFTALTSLSLRFTLRSLFLLSFPLVVLFALLFRPQSLGALVEFYSALRGSCLCRSEFKVPVRLNISPAGLPACLWRNSMPRWGHYRRGLKRRRLQAMFC